MSSFLPQKPLPVKLCRVCWTTHHVQTTGVVSRELEEWYCSEACRYVHRMKTGLLTQKDNPDMFKEVLSMVDKHFQPALLNKRKAKVLARLQSRQERAIATVIDGRASEE